MKQNPAKKHSLHAKLGQYLVTKGLARLCDVNACLQEQKRRREQGEHLTLGTLLVERQILTVDQLRSALAAVGALVAFCERCGRERTISTYSSGGAGVCTQCGAPMKWRDLTPGVVPAARTLKVPDVNAPDTTVTSDPNKDPLINRIIGGCQILQRIARGGMGVVYRAKQLTLGRTVALKVLAEELANDGAYVRRFMREARAAAELNHPNIVHINDVGEQEGIYYFIMEYVDGPTLSAVLKKRRRLDVFTSANIGYQVALALRHAHSRNIIHRDIKPENIMLTKDGVVKLADLGLAKRVTEADPELTEAGAVMGTPYYMAPEQAKDFRSVDMRSDIYSLGATLYRTVTGVVPFDGKTALEVILKAVSGAKQPVRRLRPEVPEEFEAVIHRMMEPEPAKRFQDIREVAERLAAILTKLKAPASH